MNNDIRNEWFQRGAVLLFVLVIAIWGQNYRQRRNDALKDSAEVEAIVFDTSAGRGETFISVKYVYGNVQFKNDFTTTDMDFDLGEKVLIKVSKKFPDKYISFVKKIGKTNSP